MKIDERQLVNDLRRDEGFRQFPYKDTVGKLTIGIGRNLDDVGISLAEATSLLYNDIIEVLNQLQRELPWVNTLSEPRQRALANMCFNLGINKLLKFKNTLKALKESRWGDAADEVLNSLWATQVGDRAKRIAGVFRNG